MIGRVFDWVGHQPVLRDAPAAPDGAARAPPAPPRPAPNVAPVVPRHFRADPAVMFRGPTAPDDAYRPEHPALATIAECLRARSARLEEKWPLLAAWLGADDLAYARQLCRRLNADAWPRLLLVFADALLRAQFERPEKWRLRDERLRETWSLEPWYYLDPRRGHGASFERVERELVRIRELGFANLALLANVGPDLLAGGTSELERFMNRTHELGLRVAIGVDLSTIHDPSSWWIRGDLHDPDVLERVFRTLGQEANLGVLGTRTHGVDHWLDPHHLDDAHTLHALLKLFLKKLTSREILMPEVDANADPLAFTGGGVTVRGEATTTEGDLVHWRAAMDGVRHALVHRDTRALEDALEARPEPLFGAQLIASLEHHDDLGAASLGALVDHDPQRIALAYALLYMLPATPVVYASSHHELDVVADALVYLNAHVEPGPITRAERSAPGTCIWQRGATRFVANLTARPVTVEGIALEAHGFAFVLPKAR